MEYIVAGYNMLTDIYYADGSTLMNTPGGSFYSAGGIKFWRDSLAYVGTAGPDYYSHYSKWFEDNDIELAVDICLPQTLHYDLRYREDGIWTESCTYGEEYELMAKDKGRITPEMFAKVSGPETKGIYIEASLSAKIADHFPEVKALIPNGILMWEVNGDDLRDPDKKAAIAERISQVDAFSMNFDEACGFFNTADGNAILESLKSYEKPCFLRLGEKGAGFVGRFQGEDICVFGRSIGTEASVDPTGCGNCSTACAVIGLAEGLSFEDNIAMSNLAASYCAKQNGPWPIVTKESRDQAKAEMKAYLDSDPFVYGKLL